MRVLETRGERERHTHTHRVDVAALFQPYVDVDVDVDVDGALVLCFMSVDRSMYERMYVCGMCVRLF